MQRFPRFNRPSLRGNASSSLLGYADGDGSTLSLDFTTGVLDPRLTFTRSTTATYIGADGLIKTMAAAPTNDPTKARFDYDPTALTPRGLLIEGSASNYALYSNACAGTGWSTGGIVTQSSGYATGPDGVANSATRYQMEYGGVILGKGRFYYQTTYTTLPHTSSIWMKSNTGSDQTVSLWNTSGTPVSCTVTPQWKRFQSVSTTGTSLPGYVYVENPSPTSGNIVDILVWGAQLEAGNGASSYIPTDASTGNRAQDFATMSSVDSLRFDLYQGTFLLRGTQFKQATPGAYARTMRLAGSTEPFGFAVDGLTFFGTSRNSLDNTIAETTRTNVLLENFAFGFALNANNATNTMVVSRNGSSDSANRTNTGPTGTVTALSFNDNSLSTAYASMALRSVKFWPVAKTAAELNALTAGA